MNRVLVVGDMHVVPDELGDCTALLDLIRKVCRERDIHEVWWTGDQFNTHAVLRLEVVYWWKCAFKALKSEGIRSVCLVGNHDQSSPGSEQNAMTGVFDHEPGVKVIDHAQVHGGVLMVPYMHTEAEFLKAVGEMTQQMGDESYDTREPVTPEVLFCHQTFNGATYENGFLASDGFDLSKIPQKIVISGHIHSGQSFDKLWYVGAPRWRTLSDANQDRAIWELEFDGSKLIKKTPYSTGEACRQIMYVEDTPEAPATIDVKKNVSWRVDVKGPEEWCEKRKGLWLEAGVKVRLFPVREARQGTVRESDGIDAAFRGYLASFKPKFGTSSERLAQLAKERL